MLLRCCLGIVIIRVFNPSTVGVEQVDRRRLEPLRGVDRPDTNSLGVAPGITRDAPGDSVTEPVAFPVGEGILPLFIRGSSKSRDYVTDTLLGECGRVRRPSVIIEQRFADERGRVLDILSASDRAKRLVKCWERGRPGLVGVVVSDDAVRYACFVERAGDLANLAISSSQ